MKNYFEYMGYIVWRNLPPTHKLRWYCLHDTQGQLAADTQVGIKQLIREANNGNQL